MFHQNSPYRIFAFSVITSLLIGAFTISQLGWSSLSILAILLVIEITFSFDNAIINAKILTTLSRFWQNIFLTVGILIAIFGMRIIFPIALVTIATGLPWQQIVDLAINNPDEYSKQLTAAYPSIAAFGGAFLMMLTLSFFFDSKRKILWFKTIESKLQNLSYNWTPAIVTAGVVGLVALLPGNSHQRQTFISGAIGIVTYLVVNGLADFFGKLQSKKHHISKKVVKKVGIAALMSFLYLELLDASFSLDSVIGAFAITNKVLLIAAGLGIGAIWVRSMTVFMVRRGTLKKYKYLEHGAHYTILVLSLTMFMSEIVNISESIAGLIGILFIVSSVISSKKPRSQAIG